MPDVPSIYSAHNIILPFSLKTNPVGSIYSVSLLQEAAKSNNNNADGIKPDS